MRYWWRYMMFLVQKKVPYIFERELIKLDLSLILNIPKLRELLFILTASVWYYYNTISCYLFALSILWGSQLVVWVWRCPWGRRDAPGGTLSLVLLPRRPKLFRKIVKSRILESWLYVCYFSKPNQAYAPYASYAGLIPKPKEFS